MTGTIPAERYADRLARAQAVVADRGIGGLLIGVGSDLRWLIGYEAMPLERLTMLVVPPTGRATLVVPRLERSAALAAAGVDAKVVDLVTWEETDDPVDLVAHQAGIEAAANNGSRLLVSDWLGSRFLLKIQKRLPNASYDVASVVLSELRQIKDDDEIRLLRAAAHAADRVVVAIAAGRLVGRTEKDVRREVDQRLIDEGHSESTFGIVASGPNSASPHHDVSDRVIAAGEPIVLDIGGRIEGYGSDITRTLWVTDGDAAKGPDDTYRNLFAILHRAQAQAVDAATKGTVAEVVDEVARAIITDGGYGPQFIHRTGHGIGLDGHEDPYIVLGNRAPLNVGNAFSIEPGIYLEGRYGARIEDIVICTAAGPDDLNEAPHDLAIVSGT